MTRASARSLSSPRIAIAGAGIIGLSCALELADRGAIVTLYDPNEPGRGASWAAAGMIAPAFEAAAEPGIHPKLFDLCLESARLWPDFAARLEQESGQSIGYSRGPSLALATDEKSQRHLMAILTKLHAAGLPGNVLSPEEALRLEPALSKDIPFALSLPTDGHVNNRAVVMALLKLCTKHPAITLKQAPPPLQSHNGALSIPGHDILLVTAGWQSAAVKVNEHGKNFSLLNWDTTLDDIVAYGGQMLSVAREAHHPSTTLRAGHIYMVPRADRLVIGATLEPGRTQGMPDTDGITSLKAEAARIVPSIASAAITSTWAGVRPGTPDLAPFLGQTRQPDMYIAAGHYRNGILLTPLTAQILTDQIMEAKVSTLAADFSPARTRFSRPLAEPGNITI